MAARADTNFGSEGHQQVHESSAACDLKFLNEIAASGAGTSNRRHERPASEVRDTLRHAPTRTSEAKGHSQVYDSSAAFDLKFLNEIAASGAGTSNRRHEAGAFNWPCFDDAKFSAAQRRSAANMIDPRHFGTKSWYDRNDPACQPQRATLSGLAKPHYPCGRKTPGPTGVRQPARSTRRPQC